MNSHAGLKGSFTWHTHLSVWWGVTVLANGITLNTLACYVAWKAFLHELTHRLRWQFHESHVIFRRDAARGARVHVRLFTFVRRLNWYLNCDKMGLGVCSEMYWHSETWCESLTLQDYGVGGNAVCRVSQEFLIFANVCRRSWWVLSFCKHCFSHLNYIVFAKLNKCKFTQSK